MFYAVSLAGGARTGNGLIVAEGVWKKCRRPYYQVWPAVVPALLHLRLDLDAGLISTPMPALVVRLPVERPILEQSFQESAANTQNYIVSGNFLSDEHLPLVQDCLRLCTMLCLLADDPEVITPDVLADDRQKYEASGGDSKYVDRAHRRGKLGWHVGEKIEVMPHYRRPHPALVWTGRGRSQPRIVLRKGSVVHREVLARVPTGFDGEAQEDRTGRESSGDTT
jgi:hypothetical protein